MASIAKFDQWQNSAGAPYGTVLQVVHSYYQSQFATTSTSYSDSGWTFSITPKFTTSKIAIIARIATRYMGYTYGSVRFVNVNNGAVLAPTPATGYDQGITTTNADMRTTSAYMFLDSPATTAQVTYKVQGVSYNGASVELYSSGNPASALIMEIAA